jgi:hypothetical protein
MARYVRHCSPERSLMCRFFEHLNPLANLLDPALHTLDYIRSSSTPLFTMVLAASAKFFRPHSYKDLWSHGRTMIERAINNGTGCDIGLVQAIFIAIYWKEPQDTTVWIKIGLAIRLACQLGAHLPHVRPLPVDEVTARKRLDLERTWMSESSISATGTMMLTSRSDMCVLAAPGSYDAADGQALIRYTRTSSACPG